MKHSLAIFCILAASFAGSAQDKNFDLSKYKFPDYKRHELEFNFNSSGNRSSWSAINGSNSDGTWRTVDYKDINNSSGIDLNYRFTGNSRKKQESIYSSFSSSYHFSKTSNELGSNTFSNPDANFRISAEEKYYLTENKWFLEVDPEFNSHFWASNYKSPNTDDFKQRGNSFNAQLGLGGGIGRIEYVSDYWQAYYILEELKEQGKLARNLEERDIYEFATLASQLKSKRFFDFRLKKIDEMKSLDSLLHQTRLIDQGDITYFSTLSDYWNFANISYRSSGKVFKVLVTPYFGYEYNKESDETKHTDSFTNVKSAISLNCNKQLNLFWERFFNLNFSNFTTINDDNNSFYEYPDNFLQFNSNLGWGYYPNFRTQLKTSLSYSAAQIISGLNEAKTKYEKVWTSSIDFNGSLYYYLSPQLRIEGNLGANYYDKRPGISQEEKLDISYRLGFKYSIF